MLLQIDFFIRDQVGFRRLVDNLLGLLDAGEFKDRTFVHEWYELWGPLDESLAIRGDHVTPAEVSSDLEALRSYLARTLEDR